MGPDLIMRVVQTIPSNVVSGKVVELAVLKCNGLKNHILCFVDLHLYNLVNETKLLHNILVCLFLSRVINLYKFRATMCPSSGETTVFMRHFVHILYG